MSMGLKVPAPGHHAAADHCTRRYGAVSHGAVSSASRAEGKAGAGLARGVLLGAACWLALLAVCWTWVHAPMDNAMTPSSLTDQTD
jgi:hypothetical protein